MISNQNRKFRLWLCLLLINLAIIWGNSLLPGHISGAISNAVKDFILLLLPLKQGGSPGGGGLIRKLAHFTEFTCLGICLSQLLRIKCNKQWKNILLPSLFGVAAAAIDETIQRFVPNRGPGIKDVLLDSAGVITGVIIVTMIYRFKSKKQSVLEDKK